MTSGILLVDCREAVLKESGDVILSNAPIYGEAGEIFAGTRPKEGLNKRAEAWIWACPFVHWRRNGVIGPR
jgi:hypothetical protein